MKRKQTAQRMRSCGNSRKDEKINKPFFHEWTVFHEIALFQDKANFLRLGYFQSKWPYLVRMDESQIFPWNHY
jgi:hypothetical protein